MFNMANFWTERDGKHELMRNVDLENIYYTINNTKMDIETNTLRHYGIVGDVELGVVPKDAPAPVAAGLQAVGGAVSESETESESESDDDDDGFMHIYGWTKIDGQKHW